MKRFPSCLIFAFVLLGALVQAQYAWVTQCHESIRGTQHERMHGANTVAHLVERSLCCGLVDSNSRRVEETQQVLGHIEIFASLYRSINLPFPDRPPIVLSGSNRTYQLSVENDHA